MTRSARHITALLAALLCALAAASCSSEGRSAAPKGPAVYYWRTVLKLKDAERQFLTDHRVEAVYLRMFDVVRGADGRLRPEATLLFADTLPHGVEIVPTVFIVPSALTDTAGVSRLASDIIERTTAMMVKNGYDEPAELQLDFDWTARNAPTYFGLLREAQRQLHERGKRLSVTVRLHQLNMDPPPADYGVLMMYNTGSFTDPDEECSILSERTAVPYLRHLSKYPLSLCTALPAYSWDLVFEGREFRFIARGINLSDTAQFAPVGPGEYRCRRYTASPIAANAANMTARIYPGYRIRHEQPRAEVIERIAGAIGSVRPDALNRTVIYHLDQQSITQYETAFYRRFFGRSDADSLKR